MWLKLFGSTISAETCLAGCDLAVRKWAIFWPKVFDSQSVDFGVGSIPVVPGTPYYIQDIASLIASEYGFTWEFNENLDVVFSGANAPAAGSLDILDGVWRPEKPPRSMLPMSSPFIGGMSRSLNGVVRVQRFVENPSKVGRFAWDLIPRDIAWDEFGGRRTFETMWREALGVGLPVRICPDERRPNEFMTVQSLDQDLPLEESIAINTRWTAEFDVVEHTASQTSGASSVVRVGTGALRGSQLARFNLAGDYASASATASQGTVSISGTSAVLNPPASGWAEGGVQVVFRLDAQVFRFDVETAAAGDLATLTLITASTVNAIRINVDSVPANGAINVWLDGVQVVIGGVATTGYAITRNVLQYTLAGLAPLAGRTVSVSAGFNVEQALGSVTVEGAELAIHPSGLHRSDMLQVTYNTGSGSQPTLTATYNGASLGVVGAGEGEAYVMPPEDTGWPASVTSDLVLTLFDDAIGRTQLQPSFTADQSFPGVLPSTKWDALQVEAGHRGDMVFGPYEVDLTGAAVTRSSYSVGSVLLGVRSPWPASCGCHHNHVRYNTVTFAAGVTTVRRAYAALVKDQPGYIVELDSPQGAASVEPDGWSISGGDRVTITAPASAVSLNNGAGLVRVTDYYGGTAMLRFTVEAAGDTTAPTLAFGSLSVGAVDPVTVTASDASAINWSTLACTLNGVACTTSRSGNTVRITPPRRWGTNEPARLTVVLEDEHANRRTLTRTVTQATHGFTIDGAPVPYALTITLPNAPFVIAPVAGLSIPDGYPVSDIGEVVFTALGDGSYRVTPPANGEPFEVDAGDAGFVNVVIEASDQDAPTFALASSALAPRGIATVTVSDASAINWATLTCTLEGTPCVVTREDSILRILPPVGRPWVDEGSMPTATLYVAVTDAHGNRGTLAQEIHMTARAVSIAGATADGGEWTLAAAGAFNVVPADGVTLSTPASGGTLNADGSVTITADVPQAGLTLDLGFVTIVVEVEADAPTLHTDPRFGLSWLWAFYNRPGSHGTAYEHWDGTDGSRLVGPFNAGSQGSPIADTAEWGGAIGGQPGATGYVMSGATSFRAVFRDWTYANARRLVEFTNYYGAGVDYAAQLRYISGGRLGCYVLGANADGGQYYQNVVHAAETGDWHVIDLVLEPTSGGLTPHVYFDGVLAGSMPEVAAMSSDAHNGGLFMLQINQGISGGSTADAGFWFIGGTNHEITLAEHQAAARLIGVLT